MRPRKEYMPNLREVLVVSSDEEVRRSLGRIIGLCGLEPVLCVTVADSRAVLSRYPICVVVCEDRLVDGNYRDLVEAVERTSSDALVIVETRQGRRTGSAESHQHNQKDNRAHQSCLHLMSTG